MVLVCAGPPWISTGCRCFFLSVPHSLSTCSRSAAQEFVVGLIHHVRLTPVRSPMDGLWLACRSSDAVQKVSTVTAWHRSQVRVRHSSFQQGRPSPSDLHQFFEREFFLQVSCCEGRPASVPLSVVALALDPAAQCVHPHDIVFPMLSHTGVAEIEYFSLGVPFDAVVPAASTAESNVCSGWEAATVEPKCGLIQPLLSDQRRELIQPVLSAHRQYRCCNVGTCELRCLFLKEHRRLRRCNAGYRGTCALGWSGNDGKRDQRALAGLSAAAHVPSLGSTMTGPACSFPSSSEAPVCASLVRAAHAKSSPLTQARTSDRAMVTFIEKRVKDNHLGSRLWTSARCPRTQRSCQRPPHPRGLRSHRRLSSMSPARASFGLLRVSQGPYHRMCTKCLACEARVDTCPRGVALGCHFWDRPPESVRRQRHWTASLHENKGWSLAGLI